VLLYLLIFLLGGPNLLLFVSGPNLILLVILWINTVKIIVFGSSFLLVLMDVDIDSLSICLQTLWLLFLGLLIAHNLIVAMRKWTVVVVQLSVRLGHLEVVVHWGQHKLTSSGCAVLERLKLLLLAVLRPVWASPLPMIDTIVPGYRWLPRLTPIHLHLLSQLVFANKNSIVFSSLWSQCSVRVRL
jgi:hypothetical protein